MIYPFIVNRDGIWYEAGTDVPVDSIEEKNDFSEYMNAPVDNEKSYTKTEINRMSTADLQKLAKEQGVVNAENLNGSELKKLLIKKYGL